MARMKDLTGQRFGRLVALQPEGKDKWGNYQWKCLCDCGEFRVISGGTLLEGNTKSCGCLQRAARIIHGKKGTAEYQAFYNARSRCTYPNDASFSHYGGRGIQFRFNSFEYFFAVLGPKPSPAHSIDRIDVNGHYEPGNVRWATPEEQARNKRGVHVAL